MIINKDKYRHNPVKYYTMYVIDITLKILLIVIISLNSLYLLALLKVINEVQDKIIIDRHKIHKTGRTLLKTFVKTLSSPKDIEISINLEVEVLIYIFFGTIFTFLSIIVEVRLSFITFIYNGIYIICTLYFLLFVVSNIVMMMVIDRANKDIQLYQNF